MMKKTDYNYYTYSVGRYVPSIMDNKEKFTPYKEDTSHLVWNVITDKGVYNIFDHSSFAEDLIEVKKKYKDFIDFAETVRINLQYYFWSKCEWEILVSDVFTMITRNTVKEIQKEFDAHPERIMLDMPIKSDKIDVYTQIMLNWDRFISYLWNHRELITKKKLGLN